MTCALCRASLSQELSICRGCLSTLCRSVPESPLSFFLQPTDDTMQATNCQNFCKNAQYGAANMCWLASL
eukprot:1161017-Pelagomonas_calceolata.AAC.5